MSETDELKTKIKAKIEKYQNLLAELEPITNTDKCTLYELKERVRSKTKKPKYLTGVDWLDRELGGIAEGTYINLAGQSFGGKTTLVLDILSSIAEFNPVCLFSFEMYENKLVSKLKHLNDTQDKNIIVVQRQYNLDVIEKEIREEAKNGVKFFAIDSRMKINVQIQGKEYEKIAYLSNKLSKLCQELGIIVILINQISEEDLKNKRLSLKGSGDQYYDSDMVWFITVGTKDNPDARMFHCTKDRDGERKWSLDITKRNVEVIPYEPKPEMPTI